MSEIVTRKPTLDALDGSEESAHDDLARLGEGFSHGELACEHLGAARRVLRYAKRVRERRLAVGPHLEHHQRTVLQERQRLHHLAERLEDFVVATVHGGGTVDATESRVFGRLVSELDQGYRALHHAEVELVMNDQWTDIGLSGCG